MSKKRTIPGLLVLTALAASPLTLAYAEKIPPKKASSFPDTVKDPKPGEIIVKCAGIVKKGKNHCGANNHKCNGESANDPKIKDFEGIKFPMNHSTNPALIEYLKPSEYIQSDNPAIVAQIIVRNNN